jgi:Phage tail assembly chaperone protein, TAC
VLTLRLAPGDFWALPLAEWRWLLAASLGVHANGAATDAATLQFLIHLYPDKNP